MDRPHYPRRAVIRTAVNLAALLALAACGSAAESTAPSAASPAIATAAGSASPSAGATASTSEATPLASTTASALAVTPAPASPTAASTNPEATGTPASTAASSAASSSTSAPAASPAATAPVATSSPPESSSGAKLTLLASGTQASYQVQEQLAGRNVPSQAVGRTSGVTGTIVLDARGAIVPDQSKIEVDLRRLTSDQGMRDNYIQRTPLQTSTYPTATFVPTKVTGMPWPLPSSGTATFTMEGDLTVHGTTKPVSWTVSATFAGNEVTGNATTAFTFSEFGMTAPRTAIALSVQDGGTLALQFAAARAVA